MAGLKVRTLAGAEVLSGVAPCLVRDLKQLIRSKGGPPTCQQQLLLQEVLCDEALATEDLWLVVGPGPNLWRTLVLSCDLAKEAKSSLERRFKVLEQWTQEDLLREVGVEVVRSFLEGFNGCVISYGHTGSGKERIWEEDGLLFRSLDLFFASAGHLEPWTLCCSMLLFGQYEVLDVLAEQPTALRIRGKDAEVEHLTRLSVRNLEDFRRIYAHGRSKRPVRRHNCTVLSLALRSGGSEVRELHFAECAGPGRGAVHFNVLARIMKSLSSSGHRPYRDSKFTHWLQNALGGNCLTYLLAHVRDVEDVTLEILDSAQRAQNEALEAAKLPWRPHLELAEASWIA